MGMMRLLCSAFFKIPDFFRDGYYRYSQEYNMEIYPQENIAAAYSQGDIAAAYSQGDIAATYSQKNIAAIYPQENNTADAPPQIYFFVLVLFFRFINYQADNAGAQQD